MSHISRCRRPPQQFYWVEVREGPRWTRIPGRYTERMAKAAVEDYRQWLHLGPTDVRVFALETPEPGFHRPFEGLKRHAEAAERPTEDPRLG